MGVLCVAAQPAAFDRPAGGDGHREWDWILEQVDAPALRVTRGNEPPGVGGIVGRYDRPFTITDAHV